MATDVNTLSKLLQALAERRWDDAVTLGAELAKREERQGHFQAARRLRGALGEGADPGDTPWRAAGNPSSALRALLRSSSSTTLSAVRARQPIFRLAGVATRLAGRA